MSLAIWKYPIALMTHTVPMPKGAKIICCAKQDVLDRGQRYCVWAIVNTEEKQKELRKFVILGTGEQFDKSDLPHIQYLTSSQDGPFVWHVFQWVNA